MVTSSPTIVGCVLLVTCRVVRSWTLVRAPIRMWFTSPRSTQPNQIDDFSAISTSPIKTAPSATNTLPWMTGALAPKGRMTGISAADASPRLAARQADDQGRPEDRPGGVGRPVERIGIPPRHERLVPLVGGAVEAGGEHREQEGTPPSLPRREETAGGEGGEQAERAGVEHLVRVREEGADGDRVRLVREPE